MFGEKIVYLHPTTDMKSSCSYYDFGRCSSTARNRCEMYVFLGLFSQKTHTQIILQPFDYDSICIDFESISFNGKYEESLWDSEPRLAESLSPQNQPRDYESGFHYYGARYYWSETLTGWLSVDPLTDEFPYISPYNYCAWNPVKLVDPDGRKFKIPGKDNADHAQSRADIVSLVNDKNQSRVIVGDDGFVSIDLSGLTGRAIDRLFKRDKGLALLDDLILSEKNFYYECSNYQTIDDNSKKSIEDDPNGVVNASDGGLDSKGGHTCVPRKGYNGHVVLAKSGHWYNMKKKTGWADQKVSIKSSILYHELRENYYRTECGYDYNDNSSNNNQGAHTRAVGDEGYDFGNTHPGQGQFDKY